MHQYKDFSQRTRTVIMSRGSFGCVEEAAS